MFSVGSAIQYVLIGAALIIGMGLLAVGGVQAMAPHPLEHLTTVGTTNALTEVQAILGRDPGAVAALKAAAPVNSTVTTPAGAYTLSAKPSGGAFVVTGGTNDDQRTFSTPIINRTLPTGVTYTAR